MRVAPLLVAGCLALSAPAAWAGNQPQSWWMAAGGGLPDVGTTRPPSLDGSETLPQMTITRFAAISLGALVGVTIANGAASGMAALGAGALVRNFTATVIRDGTVAVGATIGGFIGNWVYLRNWGYFNQPEQSPEPPQ